MNKKIIRQFAEQFGKEWECVCKAPFGVTNLEILTESESSLLAHYICPNCGREQMLAASITGEKIMEDLQTSISNQLNSDDVLDIRQELKTLKVSSLRSFNKTKANKQENQHIDGLKPHSKKSSS